MRLKLILLFKFVLKSTLAECEISLYILIIFWLLRYWKAKKLQVRYAERLRPAVLLYIALPIAKYSVNDVYMRVNLEKEK